MDDEHTWRRVLQIISNYDHPVVIVSATARTTRQLIAAAELAVVDFGQASSKAIDIRDRHRIIVRNFMDHYNNESATLISEKCEEWIDKCIATFQEHLIHISETGNLKPDRKDAVASIGEQLSSRLLAYCGTLFGLETVWIDARDVIKTDSDFGNANPVTGLIEESSEQISDQHRQGKVPVMGGYYGEDKNHNITTLGFEGSDFSASLVGSALNAENIEIWTDVSGIYTCDPRVVEDAFPISKLSFREATEMAYFGAKVLHPSTMNPAEQKNIPILVKNIFEPDHPGTTIQGDAPTDRTAKAMTFLKDVTIITVTSHHARMGYDFLSGVFKVLKDYRHSVNVVTTTEASISLALQTKKINPDLIQALQPMGDITRIDKQGIISLIGCAFESMDSITGMVLSAVPKIRVYMISYSSEKKNLNIVLPLDELIPSVQAIHRKLFKKSP